MSTAREARERARHEPIRKPSSADELRALVARAVHALRRIHNIDAKRQARIIYYEQKIADLKEKSYAERDAQVTLIRKLMPRIYDYVEANRFALTNQGKRKSVLFPDGTFRWQGVEYTDIPDEDAFFREVRGLKLTRKFIRIKQEPNRSALLEEKNRELASSLTSVRIVDETRPQLVTSGTSLKAERRAGKNEDEWDWVVVESRS